MSLFFALPTGGSLGTLSLLGGTITESDDFIGNGYCGIRINDTGTIESIKGDSGAGGPNYAPISAGTDWIMPNVASGARSFHVRFNTNSGDALDAGSSSAGSWIALSGDISFYVLVAGGTAGSKDHNGDLLLSDDGGSTTLLTSAGPYIFDLDDV